MNNYIRRLIASGEGIVSLGVGLSRCRAVCVSAALVSAAKVMRCIQCSLVCNYERIADGCICVYVMNNRKFTYLCTNSVYSTQ